MRQVLRFVCDECSQEHPTPEMAKRCEERDRLNRKEREAAKAEEKAWQAQGHDVWHEYGGKKHAPKVDPNKFGGHDFGDDDGTSDCKYKCGCWMGPAMSGGPVNPFGACPNNPSNAKLSDPATKDL